MLTVGEYNLIDEDKPGACEPLNTIDDYIREDREAINLIYRSLGSGVCGALLLSAGANIIDVGASDFFTVTSPQGAVVSISGFTVDEATLGSKVVVIKVDDNNGPDLITITNDDLLFQMQDGRDAVLGAGDFIIMQFCNYTTCQEIDSRITSGTWHEVGRTQARTPLGGLRFWPSIDQYGALTTEEI